MTWAQRLKRVFGIDIETCHQCGGVVKITALTHPCVRGISASMHVTALTHPCVRGISASMHVIASIEDPVVVAKILSHLFKKNKVPDKVNLPESRAPPQFCLF